MEGFQRGWCAPAFWDVQVAGVFDGRDDGGADGGQVGGPLPVRLAAVSSLNAERRISMWWCASIDRCSRTSRARSGAVASALVKQVTA